MAEDVEIRIPLLQTHEGRRIEVVRADLNGDWTVLDSSLTGLASPCQEKRRRHTAAYKFRVALEALEGGKTISQLSSEHEVHPDIIRAWKRQLLEDGPRLFATNGEGTRSIQIGNLSDRKASEVYTVGGPT